MLGFPVLVGLDFVTAPSAGSYADWVTAVATCLSVIAGLIGIFFVARSFKVSIDTLRMQTEFNGQQLKIAHAQVRPWLLLEKQELIWSERYREYQIQVTMKNYGITPAVDINLFLYYEWGLIVSNGEPVDYHPRFIQRIHDIGSVPRPIIAPGERFTFPIQLRDDFFNHDIKEKKPFDAKGKPVLKQQDRPFIRVVGYYHDMLGHKLERVNFRFTVARHPDLDGFWVSMVRQEG